eukprot:363340-Chlamydomonas_euryale.AAC.7
MSRKTSAPKTQVIRAYRLVERAPAVLLAQLLHHELCAAARRRHGAVRAFAAQHASLLSDIDVVRSGLHPRMINPTRRSELDSLLKTEAERSDKFKAMLQVWTGCFLDSSLRVWL